jgi:putative flippase GtrA
MLPRLNHDGIKQLVRYGLVGLANNFLGYLIYLAVTALGLEPKLAVTLLYPVGAATAYFGHARYSFAFGGGVKGGFVRYVIAHALGYGVNILLLFLLSDQMRFPHQLVQIFAIFVVAGMLFLLMKFFVFSKRFGECK